MVPPARLQFVGSGDYRAVGKHVLDLLIAIADLRPSERILDVGCGSGRVALALIDYLDATGSYEGFDVNTGGIDWAVKTITPRNPHFQFQVADVQNDHYNPTGVVAPVDYRFPYQDAEFDVAFATSVFTHMRAAEVRRYVAEIKRVLRPGGRAMMTFFLLNEASRSAIDQGRSQLSFRYESGEERFEYRDRLVEGVAYEESDVRNWTRSVGLEIVNPIRFGAWSATAAPMTFQDVALATRPAN